MNDSNSAKFWFNDSDTLKFPLFVLLILIGIFLEGVVHYYYGISVVYSQFYFLIVVVAGVWYGRVAVGVALFFGGLEVAVSLLLKSSVFPLDAVFRALILIVVAVVIWRLVEEIKRYRDQVITQNRELTDINTQLGSSQKAFLSANKKLNLLSSITRHDIENQLTALLAYIELSKMNVQDPELRKLIDKEEIVANSIERQIEFTRTYEDIGVKAPLWQDLQHISILSPVLERNGIDLSLSTGDLEVYADPLLEKVFENIVDNSIRHGERVRHISVSYEKRGTGLAIIYYDDGIGVVATDKEKIFEKGFGKNTGLGLFLTREILSITGLSIRECGQFGSGVRFEIEVPDGTYRFGGKPSAAGA